MIANVGPSSLHFEESLNTLKYANRAKNIKTSAKRNVVNVNYHITEYVALIDNLKKEVGLLKEKLASQKKLPTVAELHGSAT
jgi:kinesin family protein 18/19